MTDTRPAVSPHFASHEFDCHDGTLWPEWARPRLHRLVQGMLEPLRTEFGPVTIVSGYRTPGHNRRVGGARHSRHLWDSFPNEPAVDLRCRDGEPREWFQWLDRRRVGGLGLYASHVHVDLRGRHARW